MSDDSISPKAMDELVELAENANQYAIDNASNNDPRHVAERFYYLHTNPLSHIPVRSGVALTNRLFPCIPAEVLALPGNRGIVVRCRDELTGLEDLFRVEINGQNCVEISGKFVV